jgi:hypothetical protein
MASPGLINLQTDLKSLRYGSDKPYVTKDINNPPSSNQTGMQITKRIDDLTRIGKMLIDRPGLKFIGNQALLQQVNIQDKLQKSRDKGGKTLGGALLQQGLNTVVQTAKILGSTIAQVPVNGTGTHFVYAFRTDTYLQPSGGNTRSAIAQFFGAGGVEGAPFALKGQEVPGVVRSSLITDNNPLGKVQNPETGNSSKYQYNAPIKKDEQDVFWNEVANKKVDDTIPVLQNSYKAKQGQIIDVTKKEKVKTSTTTSTITDAEGFLIEIDRTPTSPTSEKKTRETTLSPGDLGGTGIGEVVADYTGPQGLLKETTTEYYAEGNYLEEQKGKLTKNGNVLKENRILLGDQGARRDEDKSNNVYWTTSATKAEIDKINAQAPVTAKVNGEEEGRDIVKFRFHVITPTETKVLYFRAFLDNFADNYTGQWNPTKYLGRGEDFQVYGGFQRKITLSFKIAAATRSEMKPLYQKMIWLASSTAPTYADNGQFMRGTIVKMTVGDYVYELPGVMNSVNYSWNVEYPWEIAMLEPEGIGDTTMQELPMIMDCSIDFTPIHTFTPETGLKKYITAGNTLANSYLLSTEQEAAVSQIVNNFRF